MKVIKKHFSTIVVGIMLLLGFSLLFYPDVASWWNGRIQRGIVQNYYIEVAQLSPEQIEDHFRRAAEHNEELSQLSPLSPLLLGGYLAPIPEDYTSILRVGAGNVMARVVVPSANINLPVYHTTSPETLHIGVGHLEGTSFPIGGESTHSVLTAHSALASATLFTHLERNINIGDFFFISVLDQRLAYQVDQILIVYPHEIESLRITPGEDLVTLITCTPYAVNSHRLLVRGTRVPYTPEIVYEIVSTVATVQRVDMRVYIFTGFFVLFILGFIGYHIYIGTKDNKIPAGPYGGRNTPHMPDYMPESAPSLYPGMSPPPLEYQVAEMAPPPQDYQTAEMSPPPQDYHTAEMSPSPYDNVAVAPMQPYGNRYDTTAQTGARRAKKRPTSLKTKLSIAACITALLLVGGVSMLIAANQSIDPQTAISNFEARIESYRNQHSEQLAAQLVDQILSGGDSSATDVEDAFHWLYTRIQEYNRSLYESGQGYLPDPFTNNQPSSSLDSFGFEEDMFGFMHIPALGVQLPIFMGTSRENLSRGAAHMTNTSLPIGGASSNAVIVGYANQRRMEMFGNVQELEAGDLIMLTNFYQTLKYSVTQTQSTSVFQADHMMIRSGMDLLTLVIYQDGQRHMIVATRVCETIW